MHGLDYFCLINKVTLTELSQYLGISKSAPTSWKNGSKNFPKKYKKAIYEAFQIPEEKQYLLEKKTITEVDEAEIELLFYQNCLNNALEDYDEDNLILDDVILKFKLDVKLAEQNLRKLKAIYAIRLNLSKTINDEIFNIKMEKVNSLIEELEQME